jgi:squalene-hopene/tetraprenyl-beta-curcumene cyclase
MRDGFGRPLPGIVQSYSHEQHAEASERQPRFEAATECARRAANALLAVQSEEGYWCGDLTGDSTLLSDYILLQLWLYPPGEDGLWRPPNPELIHKIVDAIFRHQLPDGGWNLFRGGPANVNPSVRAYTALKIAGVDPEEPRMQLARKRILELGSLQACHSYSKINLSFFGLFPRNMVPTIPPEILIIPGSFLYELSSWTRTIIVPLSILQALGAERSVPAGVDLNDLIVPGTPLTWPKKDLTSDLFLHADKLLKQWERRHFRPIRTKAIAKAERWMLEHMQRSEGLGAIYPAMMYSIMALDALGYERDHPDLVEAIAHLDGLLLERDGVVEFQPCKSPVWDTAIAAFALGELGEADPESLRRAAEWLLDKEIRRKGDWAEKRPLLRPSGWAFEFANEFYPDIDDTAMVLLALEHAKAADTERQAQVEERAINWLLGMQSSDGGWAAFDVDNDLQILNKIPFADHNAILDPTCADITGRVLDALCRRGFTMSHDAIARAVKYLLATQEPNGSWYGRWGVNYIYGTFLALRGLRAARTSSADAAMGRAAQWLISVQNSDGGWGESCVGYERNEFVPAASSPCQTAWAILGLVAAGRGRSYPVEAGVEWLLRNQRSDGTWEEHLTTGTGFPNVYYLSYDLYRNYFPLLALAAYARQGAPVEWNLQLTAAD